MTRVRWTKPGPALRLGLLFVALSLLALLVFVLAPAATLPWPLAAGVGAALGAAGVVVARHVRRPLASLERACDRLGHGQVDLPLDIPTRDEEIASLAGALERMRRALAEREAELRRGAWWDDVTGLPNRAQLRDQLQRAVDAGVPLALLLLRTEGLRHVNQAFGRPTGDRLLQALGSRLAVQVAGDGEQVARLEGGVFALLLPGAGVARARAAAARVSEVMAEPLALDEHAVAVSAEIGIACHPAHGLAADELLAQAEEALRTVRREGTRCRLCDPAEHPASPQARALRSVLLQAHAQGELVLQLKPRITLRSGALAGAQAQLVAPQDDEPGPEGEQAWALPSLAERAGLTRQVAPWTLEALAAAWPALARAGLRRASLRLAAHDLLDTTLATRLQAVLARRGLAAERVTWLVDERAVADAPERAEATLQALAKAGFGLALDGFGQGGVPLAMLQRLPLQQLQIDAGIVAAMAGDARAARVVRAAISIAHSLGLAAVADGVDQGELQHRLAALHCDEALGEHIGSALPAAQWNGRAPRGRRHDAAELPA